MSFCTLLPTLAQTPRTDDKDDVVKITTNLVQIDAVVTKDGKPVTDLSAEDFEIYEDGHKQAITSFAYISNVTRSKVPARAEAVPKPDEVTANAPPPPERVQRDVARRTIAIVVDDLGVSAESMSQIERRLRKFITEELQPNDLIAIIRTGGDVGALQQFTNDKRMLNRAVDQLRWNVCSRMGVTVTAAVESVGENNCNVYSHFQTMKAVRFILDSMGRLPGRKSMILMSDSVPLITEENNSRSSIGMVTDASEKIRTGASKDDGFGIVQVGQSVRNYGSWLRRISETAIRSSVVIYAVDTQSLQFNGITAADAVFGRIPETIPRLNTIFKW